jgi:serine/threonine protein kinase
VRTVHPYLYFHLSAVALCALVTLLHLATAWRVRSRRLSEILFAAASASLAVNCAAYFRVFQGAPSELVTRVAALSAMVSCTLMPTAVYLSGGQKRWPLRLAAGVLLACTGLYMLGGDPWVYLPSGDLDLAVLGPVPGARMRDPAAIVITLVGLGGFMAIYLEASRRRELDPDLRLLPAFSVLGMVLFGLAMATITGRTTLPPLTGITGTLFAMMDAALRLDQHTRLVNEEKQKGSLGGYQLLSRLGAGGMAEVFLAEKSGPAQFSKRLAIKRILPHLAQDATLVSMFLDEARLAARLQHPNIVGIHELGEENGVFFIVMEYVPGMTLDRVLASLRERGTTLTASLLVPLALEVLDALAYAHGLADEQGRPLEIVHRDISPQNILVDASGHAKLLDFGIARAASRSVRTVTGTFKGKVDYAAPEMLVGGPLDSRVDLFALGVVLFEMCAGRRPFRGQVDHEVAMKIASGTPPPVEELEQVPPALAAIILRALAHQPGKRYQTAGQMAEALRAALPDAPAAGPGLRALVAELTLAPAAAVDDATTTRERPSAPDESATTVVDRR